MAALEHSTDYDRFGETNHLGYDIEGRIKINEENEYSITKQCKGLGTVSVRE